MSVKNNFWTNKSQVSGSNMMFEKLFDGAEEEKVIFEIYRFHYKTLLFLQKFINIIETIPKEKKHMEEIIFRYFCNWLTNYFPIDDWDDECTEVLNSFFERQIENKYVKPLTDVLLQTKKISEKKKDSLEFEYENLEKFLSLSNTQIAIEITLLSEKYFRNIEINDLYNVKNYNTNQNIVAHRIFFEGISTWVRDFIIFQQDIE